MKTCPFCAASVQPSASICPACGRDLPEDSGAGTDGPGWGRRLVVLVALAVLGFVGYRVFMASTDPRARDAAGRCLLRARVYTDGEGTAHPRRIFGLQNLDEVSWDDVSITLSGIVTDGPQKGRPSGAFVLRLPEYNSNIASKKVRELPLDDFQSASGPHWAAMAMKANTATVTARIGRETCTYTAPIK